MKRSRERSLSRSLVVLFVLAGAGLLGGVSTAGNGDPVEEQIEALNAKYEALAALTPEGPAMTALNEAYEAEFALIGGEAPNAEDPIPPPSESVPNAVPSGIHEANEDPKGYELTNYWGGEFDGYPIFVAGAVQADEPNVGGVYLADDAGGQFYAAPDAVGALSVSAVAGTVVTLVANGGELFLFDFSSRTYIGV